MRHVVAEANDLREHEVEDAEQQQRPKQRPEIAENRAEVAELELRDRERTRDVEEAAPLGDGMSAVGWRRRSYKPVCAVPRRGPSRSTRRLVRKVDDAARCARARSRAAQELLSPVGEARSRPRTPPQAKRCTDRRRGVTSKRTRTRPPRPARSCPFAGRRSIVFVTNDWLPALVLDDDAEDRVLLRGGSGS